MEDNNYKYDINEVAGRVKAIRDSLKMSQSQFAEYIGYATDTISKIERGLRGISGEMASAISVRTGISCDYLLYGKTDSDISQDVRAEVKELLNKSIRLLDYK